MTQWAHPPTSREQMVLFAERLDDAVPRDHIVRLLDDILSRIDWSMWEAKYHVNRGQPAIHPRVLAGVLLYGLLTRIRSSRSLEEALIVRLDFRWLAEGRMIDHTTLSEFRRKYPAELKNLFVQIGLVARELGWLPLMTLAFDGTRIRANNRRNGTRTPDELRKMREELAAKYAELEAKMNDADAREEEAFGENSPHQLSEELANVQRRRAEVEAALAEIDRVKASGETVPARLPLTDPESRLTPNKHGGYAPNYTPTATVDVDSGLIVSAGVIAMTNEDPHLVPAIEDVQEQFGLDEPPPEMLADGMMCTGENLEALDAINVTLYSPIAGNDPENPALRDDPTQPVAPEQWQKLPTRTVTVGKVKSKQLDKSAFVYDEENNCYRCPQGETLAYANTTRERRGQRELIRHRYSADPKACAACPLRELCLKGNSKQRNVAHDQHEKHRREHARRMAAPEAKEKYDRRRHSGERPFAVIKQHFGARQFLTRGLDRVRCEWHWLATAFNLHRLFGLLQSGTGPPEESTSSAH